MNFDEMLIRAKSGEEPALTGILELYRPLLMKASIINEMVKLFCNTYKEKF